MTTNENNREFKRELAALMEKHGVDRIFPTCDIDIEVARKDGNFFFLCKRPFLVTVDSLTSD
jgi:hypothetical protein